jgi:copper(I)-binding protein
MGSSIRLSLTARTITFSALFVHRSEKMTNSTTMVNEKTWTYADITAEVEQQIRRARLDADASNSVTVHTMNHDFAMGAYLFWMGLTVGTHNADDVVRLKALVKDSFSDK